MILAAKVYFYLFRTKEKGEKVLKNVANSHICHQLWDFLLLPLEIYPGVVVGVGLPSTGIPIHS